MEGDLDALLCDIRADILDADLPLRIREIAAGWRERADERFFGRLEIFVRAESLIGVDPALSAKYLQPSSFFQNRRNFSEDEYQGRLLYATLGKQLESVVRCIEEDGCILDGASILRADSCPPGYVRVRISKGREKEYAEKTGKLKRARRRLYVMPELADARGEKRDEAPSPNAERGRGAGASAPPSGVSARHIFEAVACAALAEGDTAERLGLLDILLYQAEPKSFDPLRIQGGGAEAKRGGLRPEAKLPFAEWLIWRRLKNGSWILKETPDRRAVVRCVLDAWRLFGTENTVVLHRLRNARYRLLEETEFGLLPVSRERAPLARRLRVLWEDEAPGLPASALSPPLLYSRSGGIMR